MLYGIHHPSSVIMHTPQELQSLVKQYELKLSKQKDYYETKEWKLTDEVNSLKEQLRRLQGIIQGGSLTISTESQCTRCSDGEVVEHLSKTVATLEANHSNCLESKRQMQQEAAQTASRLAVVQNECQLMLAKLDASSKTIWALTAERDSLRHSANSLQTALHQQQWHIQSKLSQTQIQKEALQRKVNNTKGHSENTQSGRPNNLSISQRRKEWEVYDKPLTTFSGETERGLRRVPLEYVGNRVKKY